MHEMKLHLGCGKRILKGFVHVDLADYKHIDYKEDVRKLFWIRTSTVDLIYASHVIEYFDEGWIVSILKEWHRVLKKGGILRLAVPDFKALHQVYNYYGNINLIHGPLYGRWEISESKKMPSVYDWLPKDDNIIYHKTIYDYSSLRIVLGKAGFTNIRRWDWRKVFTGEHKGFDDYSQAYIPHMDKENGILISLNVEAEK